MLPGLAVQMLLQRLHLPDRARDISPEFQRLALYGNMHRDGRMKNGEAPLHHPKTFHAVTMEASSMTNPKARFSRCVGSRCDVDTPTGARSIAGIATASAAVQQTSPSSPFCAETSGEGLTAKAQAPTSAIAKPTALPAATALRISMLSRWAMR